MGIIQPFMYFLLVALAASLVAYGPAGRKYPYLLFFPPFLFMTFMVELWASFLSYNYSTIKMSNLLLYNFFTVLWICFYLGTVSMMITKRVPQVIMWITIPLYTIACTINVFFFQGMRQLHTVTNSIGYLLITIACIYYFYELFRYPKSIDLKKNPAFWICSALLFYCCCGVPLYGFIKLWQNIEIVRDNLRVINTTLNIFLYVLFTIAFLWARPRTSSSSSS